MTTKPLDTGSLDWSKGAGLLPGIVQDASSGAVLMLGYLSPESLEATIQRGRVVFYSRSRERLWEKGETSGHTLELVSIDADCDHDTLLLRVKPHGPACHRDTTTCFGEGTPPPSEGLEFLARLEQVIESRIAEGAGDSYTARLHAQGVRRMAQKVGEEGVEVALAAQCGEESELLSESADLLYHLVLLLKSRGLSLAAVTAELSARHQHKLPAGG